MRVLVIDYGMGNLGSVKRAVEECGVSDVTISNRDEDFELCTHVILPGVGAFPDAMSNLHKTNLVNRIRKLAVEEKIPFLGICLGMQLLASSSVEKRFTEGLGLIPGEVVLLNPTGGERIPHVGWNEIYQTAQHPIFMNIPDKSDFYFVHSFHFKSAGHMYEIAKTPYCGSFTSVIAKDNIIGTQFHPEKSSTLGFQLLKNFLGIGNAKG